MKHIKALSKTNPKAAIAGLTKGTKGTKSPCDTFLKTPEEKDAKKNTTT
jgi:hypothetical protein